MFSLRLKAAIIPKAWEAVPKEIPRPIGLLIPVHWSTLKPKIDPNIPVTITAATVREVIPCRVLDTSSAIGVVTDLGAKDRMICSSAPNPLAI